MPKITIVMPTYNQSKFIRQTINSILAQTFQDFELIIIDDGSTDETLKIVREYIDKPEPRITLQTKKNAGTGSALNYGFAISTGQYETWFASDNIMYPAALQELNDYLDNHPGCNYVYANCEIGVMDHTGLIETQRKNLKEEVCQDWKSETLMEHYFIGIVWLWRRELRIRAGEFQIEPCEDYDMVLRMQESEGRFEFLDKCLGWFRRHGENMSMKIAKSGDRDGYSRLAQRKARIRRKLA